MALGALRLKQMLLQQERHDMHVVAYQDVMAALEMRDLLNAALRCCNEVMASDPSRVFVPMQRDHIEAQLWWFAEVWKDASDRLAAFELESARFVVVID